MVIMVALYSDNLSSDSTEVYKISFIKNTRNKKQNQRRRVQFLNNSVRDLLPKNAKKSFGLLVLFPALHKVTGLGALKFP